jgi:hypothetical protein
MNILTIGLAVAFVIVVILIVFSMKKKEQFDFDSMYRRGLGKPVMSFDQQNYIVGVKADIPNSYQPTYTSSKIKIKDFLACPPGTYEMPNGKCLTSEFSPMFFDGKKWKCPANTKENNSSDLNMKCRAGYSDKKIIGGRRMCFETQVETDGDKCMFTNDTVFTTRIYTGDGKWTCPPGSVDTGITWGEGKIGGKQCLIKP